MTGRKCSTCKHYDPAPIWRKGWCRNPLLYSPQQSHLVGEDDLDCERGMGNYWEPSESAQANSEMSDAQPLTLFTPSQHREVLTSYSGRPVYPVSGSSGYSGDPDDDLPPAPSNNAPGGGNERELNYYSDERYWTDYLRIAAPIIGVILILVLFWFWANKFLGSDDNNSAANAEGTARATLPVITASPTGTTQAAGGTPSVPLIVQTPPAGSQVETPGAGSTQPSGTTGGTLAIGASVQVANTGGTGVNLRSEASTDSEVVDVLLDGTPLTVIDGPTDAEGYTWWQVQGDAGTGWLVDQYLQVTQ
jgi:hypothetical protein